MSAHESSPDIIKSAGMDPVKDGKKWKARARGVNPKGAKYITDLVGDVDMWCWRGVESVFVWC